MPLPGPEIAKNLIAGNGEIPAVLVFVRLVGNAPRASFVSWEGVGKNSGSGSVHRTYCAADGNSCGPEDSGSSDRQLAEFF